MTIYRGVGGVNREVKEIYRSVGGVNRQVTEQYRGFDGVNRKVYELDSKVYLYNEGDECTALTGGWVKGIGANGAAATTFTKNATNMFIRYNGGVGAGKSGGCGTNNKIDITPYASMKAQVSAIGGNALYYVDFQLCSILSTDSRVAYSYYFTIPPEGIFELDLSSENGAYHIALHCQADKYITIHKVWLE